MSPLAAKRLKKYSQPLPSRNGNINQDEKNDLISRYAPLVKTIAGRMALRLPQHISQDDLVGSGLLGLLDAVEKYDAGKGVEFKSYAEFRIKGAMIGELRSMDWVPRSVRRNAKRLSEAYSRVENREMRPAEDEEVAEEMGISLDEFHSLLDETRGVSLFNENDLINQKATQMDSDSGDLFDIGLDLTPLQNLREAEVVKIVADAIDRLPKNERTAMSLYYYEELTMKEIGEVMGYTESRVSQLHTRAVIRLRSSLKGYFEQ